MPLTHEVRMLPIAGLERHQFTPARFHSPAQALQPQGSTADTATLADAHSDQLAMQKVVEGYAEALDRLPPVVVWHTGKRWAVLDGFHRLAAAALVGHTEISARIFEGSATEAECYSLYVNAQHGTKLSAAELNTAIKRLLRLEPDRTDRDIARLFSTSHTTVARLRDVVEVEDDYRAHLSDQDVPPNARASQIARVRNLTDAVKMEIHARPRSEWPHLLEKATHNYWTRSDMRREILEALDPPAQLKGLLTEPPPAQLKPMPARTPFASQAEPHEPDATPAPDHRSTTSVVAQDQGRIMARMHFRDYESALETIEDYCGQIVAAMPFLVAHSRLNHARRAEQASAILSTLADRIRERLSGTRTPPWEPNEDDGPYVGDEDDGPYLG